MLELSCSALSAGIANIFLLFAPPGVGLVKEFGLLVSADLNPLLFGVGSLFQWCWKVLPIITVSWLSICRLFSSHCLVLLSAQSASNFFLPSMPLLNVSVVSTGNSHIPWTVVQIEPCLTFIELLAKILSGVYQMLHVDEFLSQSKLDKVFVGQSRDCLSIVDEKLVIDDVCKAFGQHVKFVVVQSESSAEQDASGTQTYRNAFTVLMQAQRAIDLKPLPSRVHERTKKDKLYNDIISFLESKSSLGGMTMERNLYPSCRSLCGI